MGQLATRSQPAHIRDLDGDGNPEIVAFDAQRFAHRESRFTPPRVLYDIQDGRLEEIQGEPFRLFYLREAEHYRSALDAIMTPNCPTPDLPGVEMHLLSRFRSYDSDSIASTRSTLMRSPCLDEKSRKRFLALLTGR